MTRDPFHTRQLAGLAALISIALIIVTHARSN